MIVPPPPDDKRHPELADILDELVLWIDEHPTPIQAYEAATATTKQLYDAMLVTSDLKFRHLAAARKDFTSGKKLAAYLKMDGRRLSYLLKEANKRGYR